MSISIIKGGKLDFLVKKCFIKKSSWRRRGLYI